MSAFLRPLVSHVNQHLAYSNLLKHSGVIVRLLLWHLEARMSDQQIMMSGLSFSVSQDLIICPGISVV